MSKKYTATGVERDDLSRPLMGEILLDLGLDLRGSRGRGEPRRRSAICVVKGSLARGRGSRARRKEREEEDDARLSRAGEEANESEADSRTNGSRSGERD